MSRCCLGLDTDGKTVKYLKRLECNIWLTRLPRPKNMDDTDLEHEQRACWVCALNGMSHNAERNTNNFALVHVCPWLQPGDYFSLCSFHVSLCSISKCKPGYDGVRSMYASQGSSHQHQSLGWGFAKIKTFSSKQRKTTHHVNISILRSSKMIKKHLCVHLVNNMNENNPGRAWSNEWTMSGGRRGESGCSFTDVCFCISSVWMNEWV